MADPIIQLSPEDLRASAEFASHFNGVNAAQRVKYAQDRAAYAQALQQQQAQHMAQQIATDKNLAHIYNEQKKLEMAQELHPKRMALLDAQREAEYHRMNRQILADQAEAAGKAAVEYDTGQFAKGVIEAGNKFGVNSTAFHQAVKQLEANHPAADPQFTGKYITSADAHLENLNKKAEAANVLPPSIIAQYSKALGAIEGHAKNAELQAAANTKAGKPNVPYDQTADWVMKNKEAALLEQQYPQLAALKNPQVAPVTAPVTPTATTPPVTPEVQPGPTVAPTVAPSLAPEDQQAIDWAKSNPDDPRSKDILNLHGITNEE